MKYCRDECRENHRPCHEEECKKRAAEILDRDIFTQPDESHLGRVPDLLFAASDFTWNAAAKLSVTDVIMPTASVGMKRGWSQDVHSVESPLQNRRKKMKRG